MSIMKKIYMDFKKLGHPCKLNFWFDFPMNLVNFFSICCVAEPFLLWLTLPFHKTYLNLHHLAAMSLRFYSTFMTQKEWWIWMSRSPNLVSSCLAYRAVKVMRKEHYVFGLLQFPCFRTCLKQHVAWWFIHDW